MATLPTHIPYCEEIFEIWCACRTRVGNVAGLQFLLDYDPIAHRPVRRCKAEASGHVLCQAGRQVRTPPT